MGGRRRCGVCEDDEEELALSSEDDEELAPSLEDDEELAPCPGTTDELEREWEMELWLAPLGSHSLRTDFSTSEDRDSSKSSSELCWRTYVIVSWLPVSSISMERKWPESLSIYISWRLIVGICAQMGPAKKLWVHYRAVEKVEKSKFSKMDKNHKMRYGGMLQDLLR